MSALTPELQAELKELYYMRDGFLEELRCLRSDRECLPLPVECIQKYIAHLSAARSAMLKVEEMFHRLLNTGIEGVHFTNGPRENSNTEYRFTTMMERIPTDRIIETQEWLQHLFSEGDQDRDSFLLGKCREFSKKIHECKQRGKEDTPEQIIHKIKMGGMSPEFLQLLKGELKKLEQAAAEQAKENAPPAETPSEPVDPVAAPYIPPAESL